MGIRLTQLEVMVGDTFKIENASDFFDPDLIANPLIPKNMDPLDVARLSEKYRRFNKISNRPSRKLIMRKYSEQSQVKDIDNLSSL